MLLHHCGWLKMLCYVARCVWVRMWWSVSTRPPQTHFFNKWETIQSVPQIGMQAYCSKEAKTKEGSCFVHFLKELCGMLLGWNIPKWPRKSNRMWTTISTLCQTCLVLPTYPLEHAHQVSYFFGNNFKRLMEKLAILWHQDIKVHRQTVGAI